MVRLTDFQKYKVLDTWRETGNISDVRRALGTTRKTARLWITRQSESGSLKARHGGGRRRALGDEAAELARAHLKTGEHGKAEGVAKHLHKEGWTATCVHRTTIARLAKEKAKLAGGRLRAVRGKRPKRLSNKTKSTRLQFCKDNRSRNWGNVLFTDRCKFYFKYPGCKVQVVQWIEDEDEREVTRVNNPKCINLYAGICKYGATACHPVAGTSKLTSQHLNTRNQEARNITSSEYDEVLRKTLLPEGSRIFSTHGIGSWVFQQDNDPTHRIARHVIADWNAKHASSISLLEGYPPNSPDFNPIENVWGYVQARVDELGCQTIDEFQTAVLAEIKNLPKTMLRNLIASMKARLSLCMSRNGGKSGY